MRPGDFLSLAFGSCACACSCACARACACACVCACSPEGSARCAGSFENEAPERPKSTPEGAQMASWRPPGASWAPTAPQKATQAALRPPLGGSWGSLGALLGPSWDLLGRSRALLGRSWGSFWPPGGDFFEVLGWSFWGLGPGPSKITFFDVVVRVFVCCFGSSQRRVLSCFALRAASRADTGKP